MSKRGSIRAAVRGRGKEKIFVSAAVAAAVITALHLGTPARDVSAAVGPVDKSVTAPVTAMGPGSFANLIEAVKPAVVSIAITGHAGAGPRHSMPELELPPGSPLEKYFRDLYRFKGEPPKGAPSREMRALGSGFIVDEDGYVVTNNHVVEHADEVTVILEGGSRRQAKIIGRDPRTDLALLKIESEEPLPYVRFTDSDDAKVGDWVVAVGNPFGLGGSASAGIISARGRDIQSGPYDDFLQIDAPINRGNSGGPLFDGSGRVIGVNTAIFSPSGGNVGIGFAIPANLAEPIIAELKTKGRVERGWLGVHIQEVTESLAEGLGLEEETGALVSSVNPDSPAERAGLQPGDVIIGFDGETVDDVRALPRLVAGTDEGDETSIRVWRDGKEKSLQVTIGRLPGTEVMAAAETGDAQGDKPKLGLALSALSEEARQHYGIDKDEVGVLIVDVLEGSPAARHGLKAGDLIKRIGRKTVSEPSEVVDAVKSSADQHHKSVLLLIKRGDMDRFVAVPLEAA
jgi:serine protease Do